MEQQRQLEQFIFYDFYADILNGMNDEEAGRTANRICEFMFTDNEIAEIQDKRERFYWNNLIGDLQTDKALEIEGKRARGMMKKMKHFSFPKNFYEALQLMDEKQGGQYIKAICSYMFKGSMPQLKQPVEGYFALARRKLDLFKTRSKVGKKGGTAERIKLTDTEVAETVKERNGLSFEEFMKEHPNVVNDIYASHRHLLNGIDWGYLDMGMDKHPEYKRCNGLYQLVAHYKEITGDLW